MPIQSTNTRYPPHVTHFNSRTRQWNTNNKVGGTGCTYNNIGLTPIISAYDNGPTDAYWTVEISFPTNDIVDKRKLKLEMTGRVNEVKWL